MKVKVNDTLLDAVVQTRPADSTWNGRESKAITYASTYQEAREDHSPENAPALWEGV